MPVSLNVDLAQAGLLAPLPTAFLAGRDHELLAPLRFVGADEIPSGEPPEVDRRELAQALGVANAGYGHPRAVELAEKLARPGTRVVVTGQQPGLLGGPLYALSKAVATVNWARRLEREGHSAIAVFWVATEDHDFREMSRIAVPSAGGLVERNLGEDDSPLLPIGMRTLGAGVTAILDDLRQALPGERSGEWLDRVAEWYRPDARFGEAFCRLMVGLLEDETPLLLDAMLPAVKQAERPWLERTVSLRHQIEAGYREQDQKIEAAGYPLQVHPQPGASPLFVLRGTARRRIEWLGKSGVGLRGEEGFDQPIGWLEQVLAENPAVVSPGVLARPAIQDAILGTYLQVMGPAEVSYLPQCSSVYRALGLDSPTVALRPQIMVLSQKQATRLRESVLGLEDYLDPDLDLDRALGQGRGRELVDPVRQQTARLLQELEHSALALDPNLERPWQKTKAQIERAFETFGAKIDAAVSRRDEDDRRQVETLRAAMRPAGGLQERVVTTVFFPAKYGSDFGHRLLDQVELDSSRIQVVVV